MTSFLILKLNLVGILKALEHNHRPIVVSQRIVDTSVSLTSCSTAQIIEHLVLALFKRLVQFRCLNESQHMSLGSLFDNYRTHIVESGLRICIDDGVNLSLRRHVVAVRHFAFIHRKLIGNRGGYLADKIGQCLLVGNFLSLAPALSIHIFEARHYPFGITFCLSVN